MYTVNEKNLLEIEGEEIEQIKSPHFSKGKNICDFVIIHYTGSYGDFNSSNSWASNPDSKVSWHLTISREGEVTQIHDFRTIAWHAGKSDWYAEANDRDYGSMNKYSIGIELANAGKLMIIEEDYGSSYYTASGELVPDAEVFIDENGEAWEMFTVEQIDVARDVALTLAKRYSCVDILGHSDIAPDRKIDPGSAFPLEELKEELREQEWYRH